MGPIITLHSFIQTSNCPARSLWASDFHIQTYVIATTRDYRWLKIAQVSCLCVWALICYLLFNYHIIIYFHSSSSLVFIFPILLSCLRNHFFIYLSFINTLSRFLLLFLLCTSVFICHSLILSQFFIITFIRKHLFLLLGQWGPPFGSLGKASTSHKIFISTLSQKTSCVFLLWKKIN